MYHHGHGSLLSEKSVLLNYLNCGYSIVVRGSSETALRFHYASLNNVAQVRNGHGNTSWQLSHFQMQEGEQNETADTASSSFIQDSPHSNASDSCRPYVHVFPVYHSIAKMVAATIKACPCCKQRQRVPFSVMASSGGGSFDSDTYEGSKCRWCQWVVFVNSDYVPELAIADIVSEIEENLVDCTLLRQITLKTVYHECPVIQNVLAALASGNSDQFRGACEHFPVVTSQIQSGGIHATELFPEKELAQSHTARLHRNSLLNATRDNQPVGIFDTECIATSLINGPWSDTFVVEHLRTPLYENLTRNDATLKMLKAMHDSTIADLTQCLQDSNTNHVLFPWHEKDVLGTRLRVGLRFSPTRSSNEEDVDAIAKAFVSMRKRQWVTVAQFPTCEDDPLPPPPRLQNVMALAAGMPVRLSVPSIPGPSQAGIVGKVACQGAPHGPTDTLPENYGSLLSLSIKMHSGEVRVVTPQLQRVSTPFAMSHTMTVLPLRLNYAQAQSNYCFWHPFSQFAPVQLNPMYLLGNPESLRRSLAIVLSYKQLRLSFPLRWSDIQHNRCMPSHSVSRHPSPIPADATKNIPSSTIPHPSSFTHTTFPSTPYQQTQQKR